MFEYCNDAVSINLLIRGTEKKENTLSNHKISRARLEAAWENSSNCCCNIPNNRMFDHCDINTLMKVFSRLELSWAQDLVARKNTRTTISLKDEIVNILSNPVISYPELPTSWFRADQTSLNNCFQLRKQIVQGNFVLLFRYTNIIL